MANFVSKSQEIIPRKRKIPAEYRCLNLHSHILFEGFIWGSFHSFFTGTKMTDPLQKVYRPNIKASTERRGAPSKNNPAIKIMVLPLTSPNQQHIFHGLIEVLFPLKSRRLSLERLVAVALQNLHRLTSSNIPALRRTKPKKKIWNTVV